MLPRLSCLLLSLVAFHATAQEAPTREHFATPGHEAAYHDWHYTPVVKVGDMVIVSGIPAAGPGTYEEKVRRMFVVLGKQLAQAGATYADVVELTTFHTGPTDPQSFQAEFARFAPIHHEFFPANYPAWSAVGTSALLAPGAVVEMRAVAMIGSGRAPKADIPKPKPRPATP
jgi:enamine deaminase RidA (YjgF/YER057c/UK114 family)